MLAMPHDPAQQYFVVMKGARTGEINGKVVAYVVDEQPLKLLVELPGDPVAGGLRTWIPGNDADPLAKAA